MKVYIKSLELDFSLEYDVSQLEQETIEVGCDPRCDLVIPQQVFTGLPKKILSLFIEEDDVIIKSLHPSQYITINSEPLSEIRIKKGDYALQVMQYKFTIMIKNKFEDM